MNRQRWPATACVPGEDRETQSLPDLSLRMWSLQMGCELDLGWPEDAARPLCVNDKNVFLKGKGIRV
jgi:hypothetical protein